MDNTMVALFDHASEAKAVRGELLGAGFDENDVSVFTQAVPRLEMAEKLLSWAGHSLVVEPPAFVTVYASRDRMSDIEQILQRHNPADIKWA